MSKKDDELPPVGYVGERYTPSRKDRLRPAELLIFSGILAVFVGLITLMATREPILAAIALGIVFIVALIVLAMFSLSFKPNAQEVSDLQEQNGEKPDSTH